MDHAHRAEQLFREGYNCAQAVLCAFSDLTGLDHYTAARLGSSFGGGIARMREVCGAFSGGAMVLGLLYGYDNPKNTLAKKAHYELVREFAARFKASNGSIICRELLQGCSASEGGTPEERSDHYYQKRPCAMLVHQAAAIIDEMIDEKNERADSPLS